MEKNNKRSSLDTFNQAELYSFRLIYFNWGEKVKAQL